MFPFSHNARSAWLPLIAVAMGVSCVLGQGAAQLEVREAQAAMQIAQARVQALEEKVARNKEQIISLSEGLGNANSESRLARENYEKLRLQMEGLGIAALNGSTAELQQRLLASLSDYRIVEQHKRQLAEALIGLSEAALILAKAAPAASEESQQVLNKALAAAEKAVAATQKEHGASSDAEIQNAKIVSLKNELGIAVFNVGTKHGVRPGTPFAIYRQDKLVARAVVVDVRQGICGAVVQDLVNEKDAVKVGDTGRVDASRS